LSQTHTWHRLTSDEVAAVLETDADRGLSSAEAQARLERHGPNIISRQRGKSSLRLLLDQFRQTLVLILIVAGAITAALGEWLNAWVIFGVVIINAGVGFLQEARAVKAIDALASVMTTEATVVRDGARIRMEAQKLVPGDLVILQSGDRVPADMRLSYTRDLRIDESALTGESFPAEKQADPVPEETLLADRANMSFASTLCTSGQGAGLVVATGDETEVGNISHLIAEAHEMETPLTAKIARFSRLLLWVILGLAAVTAIVGIVRGQPLVDVFLAAVALAVGAIPEGLPAAVTIVLAIGVSRMAARRAIIRRLPAVETLGGTTVICSDKTGTLTQNQMTVEQAVAGGVTYRVNGTGYAPEGQILDPQGTPVPRVPEPGGSAAKGNAAGDAAIDGTSGGPIALQELLRAGVLCNDSSLYHDADGWHISGDPTEGALIVSAIKAGLSREHLERLLPRLDTLPFESEHQYMATLHAVPGGERVAYLKGAVEKLLSRATHVLGEGGARVPVDRGRLEDQAAQMASGGLRVLAFARKSMSPSTDEITHEQVEDGLTILGLQGMMDPPREEAVRAVEACHDAGIHVKMITGDHALTAAAIAHKLRLHKPGCQFDPELAVLTGRDLEAIDDSRLPQAAEDTLVFARVTPEQKLRLVNALQSLGHVVAMTGDGVNDAPALRQADIGVAMGVAGTEVAKEAADMVLTDDNFASIEAAVEEGRGVFDNLIKFIAWALPTNLSEGLVILAAILAGVVLPILPVQILWINMTTGVVLGMTLAFEAKEDGIMLRSPRPPAAPILDRVLIGRIVIVGLLLVVGAFGLFEYAGQLGHTLAEARTVANNVIVFGELAYLFNCRSLSLPSWSVGLHRNRFLVVGVLLMIALQMLYTYLPGMNQLFDTAPIGATLWAWIIGVALLVHAVVEVEKWVRRVIIRHQVHEQAC
jgi:Ca2+-transporting ATPase